MGSCLSLIWNVLKKKSKHYEQITNRIATVSFNIFGKQFPNSWNLCLGLTPPAPLHTHIVDISFFLIIVKKKKKLIAFFIQYRKYPSTKVEFSNHLPPLSTEIGTTPWKLIFLPSFSSNKILSKAPFHVPLESTHAHQSTRQNCIISMSSSF